VFLTNHYHVAVAENRKPAVEKYNFVYVLLYLNLISKMHVKMSKVKQIISIKRLKINKSHIVGMYVQATVRIVRLRLRVRG